MGQYRHLCINAYYALFIHDVHFCTGEDIVPFFETGCMVVNCVFKLFRVFGCTTAKYAKEIKYAVYYYVDHFEKGSSILNCENMHIVHYVSIIWLYAQVRILEHFSKQST